MKIKVFLIVLLCFASLQARMLDVMIFTGMGEEDEWGAVTLEFALAVCEKSRPCIVSNWILSNFLETTKKNLPSFDFLNDKDWHIYTLQEKNDFYVCIPNKYKEKLNTTFNTAQFKKQASSYTHYSVEEILIGFALTKMVKVNKEQLNFQKHKDIALDSLKSIFIQGVGDIFGLWNIYLTGHGTYPKDVNLTAKTAQKIDLSGAFIADFSIAEYRELLQFFTKNIKVNLLYYLSCYGGDYNLILPYIANIINEKGNIVGGLEKPNFTIVAGALTSATVTADIGRSLSKCLDKTKTYENKDITFVSFNAFFDLLHSYSSDNVHKAQLYKDSELQSILAAITFRAKTERDPYGISALPQIMFPGTDTFRALALTDKISVIGDVLTKKHALENKPFELVDKEAILLYPRDIPVDMNITVQSGKVAPAIVSMQPGIGLHKIKSITSNMTFKQFAQEMFGKLLPVFVKFFYIKELKLIGDGKSVTYFNIFIVQDYYYRQKRAMVKMLFTDQDKKVYFYVYDAKGLLSHEYLEFIKVSNTISDDYLNTIYDYTIKGGKSTDMSSYMLWDTYAPEEKDILDKAVSNKKPNEDVKQAAAEELAPPPPPKSELLKEAIKAGDMREARVLIGKGFELSDEDLTELSDNDDYFKRLKELDLLPPPPPAEEEESKPLVVPEAPPLDLPVTKPVTFTPAQQTTKASVIKKKRIAKKS